MRTILTIIACAVAAAGLLATGGCNTDLAEALAANRRLKAMNEKLVAAEKQLKGQNDALASDLAAKEGQLTAAESRYLEMQNKNSLLAGDFAKLKGLYEEIKGRPQTITFGGAALPAGVDKKLKELAAQHADLITYLPEYGMVKLKSDPTFEKGSDDVKPSAAGALQAFTRIVNDPAVANYSIYIAGHTDDMRIALEATRRKHPTNWYLSVHRAVAVQQALKEAGVAEPRLCAMGFGEWHPAEPNMPGKKGNPANRRVELWIVPPDRGFVTPSGAAAAPPADAGGGAGVPLRTFTK